MNRRSFILLLFLLGGVLVAHAQYTSNGGNFKVDQIKGCAPLTVTVTTIAPCNAGQPCDMDYEGNNNFQSLAFTHTYTQPGTYTLKVLFQTEGFDQITVTVVPNIQPAFDLYTCNGNEVQVKVTDNNYNQYIISYSDGTVLPPVPSGNLAKDNHVFASSGTKGVTVRGINTGAADNCTSLSQSVDVVPTLGTPTITQLTALAADQVQLDFNNLPNTLYKLDIATNTGAFQQAQTVHNITTTTVNNLKVDDNYYRFRLGVTDPCINTTVYPADVISSANFDVAAQNNVDKLTWSTAQTGITGYSISKNGGNVSVAAGSTSYDDLVINCGTEYCYQLTSNYGNGSKSISLQKCVTAISTNIPTVVENISAAVTDNSVALQWTQDPAFNAKTYTIVKSTGGSFTSTTPSFTDDVYSSDAGSCYRINYQDVCGNTSPTAPDVCPIQLSAVLDPDNSINLSWTAYGGWKNGVGNYHVEKYDDQGQLLQTFDVGTATTLLDNVDDFAHQVYHYRVTATAVDAGIPVSISNMIEVIKAPNLFYPSAFTPNGDGLNDVFKVVGQYTARFEFKIFNRWGEQLFFTDDSAQGWDGTYKGNLMPEGTYVFRAKITDLINRTSEQSGTIVLFRKH